MRPERLPPLLRGRTISEQPCRGTGLAMGAQWEAGGDPAANLSQLVQASWPAGGHSRVWPGLPQQAVPLQAPGPPAAQMCMGQPWPGRRSLHLCLSSFYNPG